MEIPATQYARSGGLNLAYQDFGEGDPVVLIPPLVSNVELSWEHELFRRPIELLASSVRLIQFDKRGIGSSDGFDRHPRLAERIADITAVMDAAGVERAHLIGLSEGGLMSQLFAAEHPQRVDRLVLVNTVPGPGCVQHLAEAGRPWDLAALAARFDALVASWGRDPSVLVDLMMPSQAGNESLLRWLPRYQRFTASPAALRRQIDSVWGLGGVRDLSRITAPTLVAHAVGDRTIPVDAGRCLAGHIPGARFVEFDSEDHILWVDPDWRSLTLQCLTFLLGREPGGQRARRFAAILFTDLVDSTATSSAMGDERWTELIGTHDRIADRVLAASGGRLVKRTGDGLLATFDTASAAVRAAADLVGELAGVGLRVRAGVHAGEIDVHDDGDISGLAVNIAARVEAAAAAGEVLVTSTVRDMLLGTGLVLADRGEHTLKGIDGAWTLHAVANRV